MGGLRTDSLPLNTGSQHYSSVISCTPLGLGDDDLKVPAVGSCKTLRAIPCVVEASCCRACSEFGTRLQQVGSAHTSAFPASSIPQLIEAHVVRRFAQEV